MKDYSKLYNIIYSIIGFGTLSIIVFNTAYILTIHKYLHSINSLELMLPFIKENLTTMLYILYREIATTFPLCFILFFSFYLSSNQSSNIKIKPSILFSFFIFPICFSIFHKTFSMDSYLWLSLPFVFIFFLLSVISNYVEIIKNNYELNHKIKINPYKSLKKRKFIKKQTEELCQYIKEKKPYIIEELFYFIAAYSIPIGITLLIPIINYMCISIPVASYILVFREITEQKARMLIGIVFSSMYILLLPIFKNGFIEELNLKDKQNYSYIIHIDFAKMNNLSAKPHIIYLDNKQAFYLICGQKLFKTDEITVFLTSETKKQLKIPNKFIYPYQLNSNCA